MLRKLNILFVMIIVLGLLAGCAATPTPAPVPTQAPAATKAPAATQAPTKAPAAKLVNSVGVELPADAAPLDQQVLIQMTETEPKHLDRSASLSGSGSIYPFLISEPLVKLNEDFTLLPAGAEKWSVAADNVTWTFNIRKGMKWSDGQPFTAKDYEYMYQRMADPKTAFDWGWFYTDIVNFSEVQAGKAQISELGVKAIDDYTLQIVTKQPEPYFPQKCIMMVPAPKHIASKDAIPGAWAAAPETCVSGGPFKLTSWEKGKQMVFTANKDYTGPFKPLLEKQIYLIGSTQAVMPAYEANQIDAVAYAGASGITTADIAKGKTDAAKSGLHFYVDFRTQYIALDSTKPPFNDVKVRQAFAKAIDRDGLTQSAAKDMGIPAYSMLMPGFHANNVNGLKQYQAFDKTAAQKLLSDAGFPGGKGFPTDITLTTYNTAPKALLEAIVAQWKENLGVTVNLNLVEYATYADKRGKHELQMLYEGYQFDYTDASHLMDMWAAGSRFPWTNADFQKLVDQADHLVGDDAGRIKLYQDAEKILSEQVGGIFLLYDQRAQFWKPYVKGKSLEANKDGIVAFRGNKLGLTDYTVYITKDVANFRK